MIGCFFVTLLSSRAVENSYAVLALFLGRAEFKATAYDL